MNNAKVTTYFNMSYTLVLYYDWWLYRVLLQAFPKLHFGCYYSSSTVSCNGSPFNRYIHLQRRYLSFLSQYVLCSIGTALLRRSDLGRVAVSRSGYLPSDTRRMFSTGAFLRQTHTTSAWPCYDDSIRGVWTFLLVAIICAHVSVILHSFVLQSSNLWCVCTWCIIAPCFERWRQRTKY